MFGPRGSADQMFDLGYDDTPSVSMPKIPAPRETKPDMGSMAVNLASNKMDMLSHTAGMNPRMSSMLAGGAKKLPVLGGLYTGYQTYQNNPANLSPMGRMAHAGVTGAASVLTPPMLGIADAATGNRFGNTVEDLSGAALRPFFGAAQKKEGEL